MFRIWQNQLTISAWLTVCELLIVNQPSSFQPNNGIWSFSLHNDDGGALWIDGVRVVDNDGIHDLSEAQGTIPLGKGLHFYKLVYFDDEGDQELTWSWKAPGADRYVTVPSNKLYFK